MRILILLLSATLAAPALAGDASGQFKADPRAPIRPKYAAAYETRDLRDSHKHAVEVILSEAPIDAAAAVADLDPHTNAINQPALMEKNYIVLVVRPDGDVSMNATYSERMVQFVDMTGAMGDLKAEISTNTPDRVAGRVFSPKPVKTDSGTWTVDVKFSTDVTRLPPGMALPAGGGDPGKALTALLAAKSKKNWEGIRTAVVKPFDDLADALQSLDIWLPKKGVKITGGVLRGDTATLDVEGEMFEKQKGLFLVRMQKSGTKWLFDRAMRAGFID